MHKRYLITLMVLLIFLVTISPSHAVPGNDIEFPAKPFWQFGMISKGLSGWERVVEYPNSFLT